MKRTLCFWKSTDTACRREGAQITQVPLMHTLSCLCLCALFLGTQVR